MKKITIVGACPAGLTAAYEILKNTDKYEVTILEQTDRIGDIVCTIQHNGNYMDFLFGRFVELNKDKKYGRVLYRISVGTVLTFSLLSVFMFYVI